MLGNNVHRFPKRILAERSMGLRADVEREWLEREQRIARYCAGRLSAVEEEAFEAELIDDTELASDVQLAMVLRDSLQELGASASTASNQAHPLRSPWLALAAGIVLGVIGLSLVRGPGGRSGAIEDVEYLTLGVVRSAQPEVTSATSRVGERSLLIIEVPAEHSTSQIELVRPDGRREQLAGTRDQGYLRIALQPPISPGEYAVVSGEVDYAFTVEPRLPGNL